MAVRNLGNVGGLVEDMPMLRDGCMASESSVATVLVIAVAV
jgi:hypothetical protein